MHFKKEYGMDFALLQSLVHNQDRDVCVRWMDARIRNGDLQDIVPHRGLSIGCTELSLLFSSANGTKTRGMLKPKAQQVT